MAQENPVTQPAVAIGEYVIRYISVILKQASMRQMSQALQNLALFKKAFHSSGKSLPLLHRPPAFVCKLDSVSWCVRVQ